MKKYKFTFLLPTRNTLPYTKLAYQSLRTYNPGAEIIMLDDLSTDGTKEWMESLTDPYLVKWFNDPEQFPRTYPDQKFSGHTITYNIGATMAQGDYLCAFHSDMICTPNFANNLLKHLGKAKTIVSGTRIEPPIYPADKAKILKDFGFYHNEFKAKEFNAFVTEQEKEFVDRTTAGFFAPWAMFTQEYLDCGGMDPIYAPYPIEDSDFINRLWLNGFNIIQSRDAFVYHWASRGHKFTTGKIGVETEEYQHYTTRALKNYITKWGDIPRMNEYSYPIVNVDLIPK